MGDDCYVHGRIQSYSRRKGQADNSFQVPRKTRRYIRRILLPPSLREFADLDKEVILAGVGGHIEIWSKDRWAEASEYDDMDDIAEHMAELGLMI